MNFVSHAVVASWRATDPAWVFGAMLPDFASMARCRVLGADEPRVSEGLAHHHATDEVFHHARSFIALNDEGVRTLSAHGVRRGPARAVAHVGVELMLDGLLLDDPGIERTYLRAISVDSDSLGLRFRGTGGPRFAEFSVRLRAHGLPNAYRTPEGVLTRLEQTLSRRPRLAWTADETPEILAWLRGMRHRLALVLPTLLGEVRLGLEAGSHTDARSPSPG